MSIDPITFSIIRHRLFRVVDEAVITLKNVSGSAITNEGHDLMVSLYRADGSLLMGGVGFLHHLTSAAEACKAIIRRFGEDVHENDLFLLNDPYTAALHTSDVYFVSPIHYKGKLVAWSACFVHVYDIGAMNPGGFSPDSPDIYTEGFSSAGLRLIEKGVLRQDVFDTLLNMVRSPEMVALDLRSMIACNHVAKERMISLIVKYGVDTVDAVCSELIAQSEHQLRARLRQLPDGCWQSRQYLDVKGISYTVALTMTKDGDQLTFDFSGSSPQSQYAVNCTRWASLGGLFAPLFPLLCYDIVWNEGVIRPVKMIAPEGTIVNCRRPAPVSVATVGAIQSVNNAACAAIGKLLESNELYRTEATAVWHANHFAIFKFGVNQHGQQAIGIFTETFAGAGGGRAVGDGVDVGGEIPNPISRMANVETVEAMFPIRYLFRRRATDSAGPGRYRGGSGMEFAVVPHCAPEGGIHFVLSGKGSAFPMSDGLAGGYPGAPNSYVLIRNEANPGMTKSFIGPEELLQGRREAISWGVYPLFGRDTLWVRWNGGGGYGDPLERDPSKVLEDLQSGTISEEALCDVYGVVLDAQAQIDPARTAALRGEIRARRISLPAARVKAGRGLQASPQSTAKMSAARGRFVASEGRWRCARCEHDLGPQAQSWKRSAVLQERPMMGAGGRAYTSSDAVRLRLYCCPSCACLLETETALSGDPPLEDVYTCQS